MRMMYYSVMTQAYSEKVIILLLDFHFHSFGYLSSFCFVLFVCLFLVGGGGVLKVHESVYRTVSPI